MATVEKSFRIKQGLVVEGATATVNGSNVLTELSTNTVSNKTINISTTSGNVLQIQGNEISSYVGSGNNVVLSNTPTISNPYVSGSLGLNGATTGFTSLKASDTAGGVITFPAVTGTVITTADTGTVTNTMLAGSIANNKLANSSITINSFPISLGGSATFGTDNIGEGTSNLYFTNERAQDALALAFTSGTHTNITITYNDSTNSFDFNASGGVSSLTGTANEIEVSSTTGAITVGLPDNIAVSGNITINGTPSQSTHAVTKGYVDEIAQGLHIHESCVAATTGNISIATDLEPGDVIDGVTLAQGNRVLVKNQSTTSQNGIYVVQASGAALRAADFNEPSEVHGGDFIFVTGGNLYDNTGWVQTSTGIVTIGTDPIVFTQFSGAGTYNAGNGLTLTGNVFSIDTGITVDLSSVQSLTNKTLTSPTITNPTVSGLYLSDNNIVIEGNPDTFETTLTFTNPTDDRTITFKDESGTVAYTADVESAVDNFGSAVTGGTGISASYNTGTNILTVSNLGVSTIAGTANQVIASASTGSVALSLPQNIHTGATPTFAGISVGSGSLTAGSVTLTDALLGTATVGITGTGATVVDSWSAASYSSAKYLVQMKNGNDIEVIEVLVTIDGNNNVYLTEYADVISNTQLGTTDADYSGGNVRLLVTSTNGTTVKVHKTLIEA